MFAPRCTTRKKAPSFLVSSYMLGTTPNPFTLISMRLLKLQSTTSLRELGITSLRRRFLALWPSCPSSSWWFCLCCRRCCFLSFLLCLLWRQGSHHVFCVVDNLLVWSTECKYIFFPLPMTLKPFSRQLQSPEMFWSGGMREHKCLQHSLLTSWGKFIKNPLAKAPQKSTGKTI